MNEANVRSAIAVMERVRDRGDKLNMKDWQDVDDPLDVIESEDDAHSCGTACCFAGWLAISPEFKTAGGSIGRWGGPKLEVDGVTFTNGGAVARYLDIEYNTTLYLTAVEGGYTDFYGVENVGDITPQMVIDKLNLILTGELS